MKLKLLIITSTAACLIIFSAVGHGGWWPFDRADADVKSKSELIEITWDDLIPDDFVQPENPFAKFSKEKIDKLMDGSDESNAEIARLQKEFNYAPVGGELDGKRIKIPAYITPLEFDGQTKMREFLLVPYVGACMHTPPPPANQVLHAESTKAVDIKSMYDAVWAIGTIKTETVKSDLAESGYRIEIEDVVPYTR